MRWVAGWRHPATARNSFGESPELVTAAQRGSGFTGSSRRRGEVV